MQKFLSGLFFLLLFGGLAFLHPTSVSADIQCDGASCVDPEAGGGFTTTDPIVAEYNVAIDTGSQSLYTFAPNMTNGITLGIGRSLCPDCLGMRSEIAGAGSASRGFYPSLIGMIKQMYEYQPATTDRYVAMLMRDMNIAPPAYAQGVGFASLDPILGVWRTFRNIAYTFFVVIFLVIGFMMMFRQKIGSQSVVTAQQALPRIVVALLLVTFSYAIAGLMIDAMYLVMFLMASMFSDPTNTNAAFKTTELLQGNAFQLAGKLITSNAAGTAAGAVASFVFDTLGQGVFSGAIAIVAGLTGAVIFLIVIVINAFRLFLILVRVYLETILMIAFAPVILMMQAVPGNNSFANWFKGLTANLAVFPGILGILIIFNELTKAGADFGARGFLPPYVAGMSTAGVVSFLAGFGLIMALPEAADEISKLGGQQGGLFAKLIRAGWKTAEKASDIAIPVSGAVGGGVYGAVRAGNEAFNDPTLIDSLTGRRNWRKTIQQVIEGTPTGVGGARPRASQFFGYGQNLRKTIDDLRDGRFLDPNNIYKLLQQQQGKKT